MNNPPQPQGEEFENASNLGADRGELPHRLRHTHTLSGGRADIAPNAPNIGWDKSKLKNEGVPVDSALTGIPIAILGKDRKFGEMSACRLSGHGRSWHVAGL